MSHSLATPTGVGLQNALVLMLDGWSLTTARGMARFGCQLRSPDGREVAPLGRHHFVTMRDSGYVAYVNNEGLAQLTPKGKRHASRVREALAGRGGA